MRCIALFILLSAKSTSLDAQFGGPRPTASAFEVVAGNVLAGGITAAVRAVATRQDPLRAFAIGAFGGGVHLVGKNLAVESGPVRAWIGTAISGTGISMIANGSRGLKMFDEVDIPILVTRLRLRPRDRDKIHFAVNAFETGTLITAFFTRGAAFDLNRSLSTGTAVFVTRNRRIVINEAQWGGFAAIASPVVFLDTTIGDPERTLRHEVVHAHQHWFMQDAWGRPVDEFLRRRLPGFRFIPRWIDLGIAAPAIAVLEQLPPGKSGLKVLIEAEAERLERR
jgi:hypothetical protein